MPRYGQRASQKPGATGDWRLAGVPRQGVKVCRERATNLLTVTDIVEMGLEFDFYWGLISQHLDSDR